jgi:hypothetical protein
VDAYSRDRNDEEKNILFFSSSFRSLEGAGLPTQSMQITRAIRYFFGNGANTNSIIFHIITTSKYSERILM